MIKENIISATLINDVYGNQAMIKVVTNDNQYWIPFAPDNTDYQAYLKWVEDGGVPTPADE